LTLTTFVPRIGAGLPWPQDALVSVAFGPTVSVVVGLRATPTNGTSIPIETVGVSLRDEIEAEVTT
jgi:hypothetical protein